tara:strand:+ start:6743 stop:7495 length:753 start_codon:yes stop_codon:yes gene_type:complete
MMTEIYNKLLDFLKKENCEIDQEIKFLAEQLSEMSQLKGDEKDIDTILNWLEEKRKNYNVETKEIGVNELKKWRVEPETGNISHESGKFYSVIGVGVTGAQGREVTSWTQPMIKQDECGILGILCKKIDGTMHYLLQAKYEPGNTYKLQLSPTLQATESNLKQAHKGKKPLFAEYFEEGQKGKVLTSVVSVEDGGRFYLKTNKNMIVEIDENEEIEIPENFIWLNLYQLKKLIKKDNIANSLTRSVLGSL